VQTSPYNRYCSLCTSVRVPAASQRRASSRPTMTASTHGQLPIGRCSSAGHDASVNGAPSGCERRRKPKVGVAGDHTAATGTTPSGEARSHNSACPCSHRNENRLRPGLPEEPRSRRSFSMKGVEAARPGSRPWAKRLPRALLTGPPWISDARPASTPGRQDQEPGGAHGHTAGSDTVYTSHASAWLHRVYLNVQQQGRRDLTTAVNEHIGKARCRGLRHQSQGRRATAASQVLRPRHPRSTPMRLPSTCCMTMQTFASTSRTGSRYDCAAV